MLVRARCLLRLGAPHVCLARAVEIRPFSAGRDHPSSKPLDNGTPPRKKELFDLTSADLIERWTPDVFRNVGVAAAIGSVALWVTVGPVAGAVSGLATLAYWKIGYDDMHQTTHAIRRNFPVLGNLRYVLESIRCDLWARGAKYQWPPHLHAPFAR
jgi:hypothetical protein